MQKTISIFSTKAGVGSSTIAWNLGLLLGKKIYESDGALFQHFGRARSRNTEDTFFVDKLSKVRLHKNGGIYKLDTSVNDSALRNIIAASDVIIIPSFYDHITLLHTVSTMKIIDDINSRAKVIVIFNRLSPQDFKREKAYTKYARERLQRMLKEERIGINFTPLYMRQDYVFFRFLEGGEFFLDQFFQDEHKHQRLIDDRFVHEVKDDPKERRSIAKRNIAHLENLNHYYNREYRPAQWTKQEVENEDIYIKNTVRLNSRPVRDMLRLVQELGVDYG